MRSGWREGSSDAQTEKREEGQRRETETETEKID